MATQMIYSNANGKNVTLVNPDTNFNEKTIDISSLASESYVKRNSGASFVKPNTKEVLFIKTAPAGFKIPAKFKCIVSEVLISLESDYPLSLNSNLDTGTKIPGEDYYVYAKVDATFFISLNNNLENDTTKLIGGFHYGLTPETEVKPAGVLKTEADMVTSRGIKAYSFWDLNWKPANKYPEGKVLINGRFWRDIYPGDEDYAIRGYSSCFALDGTPAKIAGGAATNGRKMPKIPLSKGGNGTTNYGSLTWYDANEIISEAGMRMISYEEFSNSSYGVQEQMSLQQLGYPVSANIKHYPQLESKWGVEMAVGVQYYWGSQIMNGYGTTDLAHRNNLTNGRGGIYATSNSPVGIILGGYELSNSSDNVSGSRYLSLSNYVWNSNWRTGFLAVCDHVNLD